MTDLGRTKYGEYDIYHGDRPLTDMVPPMRQTGALERSILGAPDTLYEDVEQEEAFQSRLSAEQSSGAFERTRSQVRGALRAIVGFAVDRFQIPRGSGCDFRSGAAGEMVEQLLASLIDKEKWLQMESNPYAVELNKRRNPDSRIVRGSYHNVHPNLYGQLDVVTGLSALDSTLFLSDALDQIGMALKEGGILLHVQDVRPGFSSPYCEMRHRGFESPFLAEGIPGRTSVRSLTYENPILTYVNPRHADAPEGEVSHWTVGELFRARLGRKIDEDPELELLMNDWVTSRRSIKETHQYGRLYWMNILAQTLNPDEEASAVVTVARKKSTG